MISLVKKVWRYPDLRGKVFLTVGLIILYRILAHIPLPGVDRDQLANFFASNDIFNLLDLFSGGGLRNVSIVLMGVGPYITSSIIFQLLTSVIPALEELQKEGEYGRQKINQYTRLATVPFALIQGYATLFFLKSQGVIAQWTSFELVTMLVASAAGTTLLVWLGELISEGGIGNGISVIITVGILAALPTQINNALQLIGIQFQGGVLSTELFDPARALTALGFLIFAFVVTAAIVYVTEGERRIPVTYAKRLRSSQGSAGVESHLPLRVTAAGVIPLIFAISLMLLPTVVTRFLSQAQSETVREAALWVEQLFANTTFYSSAYFLLVVVFTFFYSTIIFQPKQIAENLQRQSGFVPGIRPGRETAAYLEKVIARITLAGALFLGLVAILPFIVQLATQTQTLVLGGTGILIIVAVAVETIRQFRAELLMRTYEHSI